MPNLPVRSNNTSRLHHKTHQYKAVEVLGRQRKHEDPSAGERKPEDEVKVHVSFYGGLRVDLGELLRSKAAQDNIKKMCEVFGPRSLDASEAESRSQAPPAASVQQDFGDSGAG